MNNNYQVYQIAREQNPIPREDNDESANKAWYSINGLGECLFKAATTTPGSLTEYRTDWSEKVVERLANILGLPVAQYEFATAYLNGSSEPIEGVISVDCIPNDADISSGGFFLRQTFDDKLSRKYNIDNILSALNIRSVKPPRNWKQQIPGIDTGAKLFVGYLMLDALVQNEDRHGGNWAVMLIEGKLELTSSFDHGVSLGSRNSNEDKLDRSTPEYINESSFSHFKQLEGLETVSVFNVFRRAVKLESVTAKIWLDKLVLIDSDKIDEIFKLIPEQRITPTAANFAKLLLLENLKKIRLELAEIVAFKELSELPDLENPPNPDDSPEPPNDSPEPPPNPRNPPNPPKPSTPPNSPDSTNSPDPPIDSDATQSISISVDVDAPGIVVPNIDSEQSKFQHPTLQYERQIMTDLEGFHGNAQNQASTSAKDISKLGEELGEALGSALTDESLKRFFQAYDKLLEILRRKKEQGDVVSSIPITAEGLAKRKEGLKTSKQRLTTETREFRRDSRKYAIKVGLDYIVSLFKNVKKFLKDTWEAPGRFFQGVKNKFKSLKEFMFQETKGEVNIGRELSGNKQEQAEKFIKLLNTPAGEQAPEGLENTIIAPWGENLIVVDAENNVTANLIQPLMDSEFVQLAIDKNVVAAAVAPNIQPVANSLASHELGLHGELIGQEAIDQLLANVQKTQLGKSTIKELEAIISQPSEIQLEAVPDSIEQPLTSVSVEAENAVLVDDEGVVLDPFNEPEVRPVQGSALPSQKESIQYSKDSSLLEDREFCDGLISISDLYDRYASENENSKILSIRGEGYVGYEYDPDLEEKIEQYYEQSVNIVGMAASISENKAYLLKNRENHEEDILSFEIQPDRQIVNLNTNFETSYIQPRLVSALSKITTAPERSKWKIIDISKQVLKEVAKGEVVTPETQPVVVSESFGLTEAPQLSHSPKSLVPAVAAVNKLSAKDEPQASISPPIDFVGIVVTPKLANDLVTIAQLHQIGTLSDTSSLPLIESADDRPPLLITQTNNENGSAIYQVVNLEKEFNFTIAPEQIVTNFNISKGNNFTHIRQLVTSIANVLKAPEQTDFQPHAHADLQRIETVQQLNGLLNETATQTDRSTRSVVTLDNERFGMKIDVKNRKVVITDKTTSETVAFGKNGIEDGGLLKKMTEVAKDKTSSLAQRLVRVVVEKTNEAKTVLDNAPSNIMAALDERASADRATAQKASKAVNRIGAQIDGYIEQGILHIQATNSQMFGTVDRMKKIEQVDDAIEERVKEDLQSVGEHLIDSAKREEESISEPSIDKERAEFQRELNAVVVHKSQTQTSSPAIQPVR